MKFIVLLTESESTSLKTYRRDIANERREWFYNLRRTRKKLTE